MRFRDRPLLVDGLDAALYLDRPDLERRVLEPLATGGNVLLLGEAGSGKSTLLRKAAAGLAGPERPAVIVNAGLADDAAGLLELVRGALGGEDDRGAPAPGPPDPGGPGLLRAVRRLRRDPPAAILVDGLVDPDAGFDLFGRLRDELWALGHAWAVAARPRDSAPLRTPPADAFWSAVVEIPPLGDDEVGRLLRLGLSSDELGRVERVRPLAPAYPRQVIRAVRDALERGGRDAGAAVEAQVARAAALGRSEGLAAAELRDLGRPVSAHDPDLLGRLAWSRPYAQRILANLEEHRVVRSIPERTDRPGRPRKLYELNPTPPPTR
jgi:energy-coupling factor transporter ATP-binding protein EcfA2